MEFFKFIFTAEADTTGEESTPTESSTGGGSSCVVA
jgi:hypothetical protein